MDKDPHKDPYPDPLPLEIRTEFEKLIPRQIIEDTRSTRFRADIEDLREDPKPFDTGVYDQPQTEELERSEQTLPLLKYSLKTRLFLGVLALRHNVISFFTNKPPTNNKESDD